MDTQSSDASRQELHRKAEELRDIGAHSGHMLRYTQIIGVIVYNLCDTAVLLAAMEVFWPDFAVTTGMRTIITTTALQLSILRALGSPLPATMPHIDNGAMFVAADFVCKVYAFCVPLIVYICAFWGVNLHVYEWTAHVSYVAVRMVVVLYVAVFFHADVSSVVRRFQQDYLLNACSILGVRTADGLT